MIKHLILVPFIVLCLITQLGASSLEQKYLETRDSYIERFKKSSGTNDEEDKQALNELENLLKQIIGPIKIEGFQEQGKINLETLDPDWDLGFGQLDGLRFESKNETLVITTDTLLKNYLESHEDLPKDYGELFKNDNFYSNVFVSDAAGTHYGELPIKKEESFTYAALGGFAQDIGPFIPATVFVFAVREDKIFLVSSDLQTELQQIPQCAKEWDKYNTLALEADEKYMNSDYKDRKLFEQYVNYQSKGFKAYCDCYGRLAKNQKSFDAVIHQAQSIVDRLDAAILK